MYNEFRRDILGVGHNGRNSNADGVMLKTSPQKLERHIAKAYDFRSSCIKM